MERIISALNQITEINNAYEIPTDQIEDLRTAISEAKVCTPIIGKFSSGKSALVNTILGYSTEILKRDITPETAVPAELSYSDEVEIVHIIRNDGTTEQIAVDEYKDYEADATTVKCARLYLNNSFLKKIPDVMLVDMPGFESGFEIHNKAIDNYLPDSLAYIVAVPADDLIIRDSIGKILKELCLHDMPLCIAITKYDKRTDAFEESLSHMKESLKRYVGDREITYCLTSWGDGDAEELEEYLESIQEQSQDILMRSFIPRVLTIAGNTESYLKTALENNGLSESELAVKEDELNGKLRRIEDKFASEKTNFDAELKDCVKEIKQDVQHALEAEEDKLVIMSLNGQDIKETLNNTIRSAVTISVQKRLVAKIEKYIKRVADCMNSEDIGDVDIPVNISMKKLGKNIIGSVVAVLAGIFIGPITAIITGLMFHFRSEKKKEEKKQQIRSQLRSDVFPRVLTEVGHNIEQEVTRIIVAINSSIENDYNTNKQTMLKSIEDLRKQIEEENATKEKTAAAMQADLIGIKKLKDSLI